MPKFSEPELCLLRKWEDARLLEEGMKTVRAKYKEMFETVLEDVQDKYPELDRTEIHLANDGYNVGIGKDAAWPTKPNWWTSGFWLSGIRMENLTSEDEEAPCKVVLLNKPQGVEDLEWAKDRLCEAAERILTKDELPHLESDSSGGVASIFVPLGESRERLLELLLADEARGFVGCMVAHFESMMAFIPVLDEIYKGSKRIRK
ncbi:MAG: hypothetical protein ACLP9L_18870 [Thermoguttaceae bacterium]